LDDALIRPGRCDVHVLLGLASKDQAKRMFQNFYGAEDEALANSFLDGFPVGKLSMASLQGYFMKQRLQAQMQVALGYDMSHDTRSATTPLGAAVDLPANEEETAAAVNKRAMELAVENVGKLLSANADQAAASCTD